MGRVVVVTGGSRGIGAATAVLAAAKGYGVCLSYREREDAAREVVAACRDHGVDARAVRADVGDEADVRRLFSTVDGELGPLYGLVNNAGILEQQGRVVDVTADRLERIFRVNVTGAFLCAREAVRRMTDGGAIVNVSSRASVLGSPGEYVDYAASKAALDTLTIGLAQEVARDNIRVNAVRPGIIDTDIHALGGEPGRVRRIGPLLPMGRAGTADEVAEAIVWLLSPAASFVTGTFIEVSGGR